MSFIDQLDVVNIEFLQRSEYAPVQLRDLTNRSSHNLHDLDRNDSILITWLTASKTITYLSSFSLS